MPRQVPKQRLKYLLIDTYLDTRSRRHTSTYGSVRICHRSRIYLYLLVHRYYYYLINLRLKFQFQFKCRVKSHIKMPSYYVRRVGLCIRR